METKRVQFDEEMAGGKGRSRRLSWVEKAVIKTGIVKSREGASVALIVLALALFMFSLFLPTFFSGAPVAEFYLSHVHRGLNK